MLLMLMNVKKFQRIRDRHIFICIQIIRRKKLENTMSSQFKRNLCRNGQCAQPDFEIKV